MVLHFSAILIWDVDIPDARPSGNIRLGYKRQWQEEFVRVSLFGDSRRGAGALIQYAGSECKACTGAEMG